MVKDASSEFDLVIIGGGSAAFAAAIKATGLGARVAVCEKDVIGGTCLNRGCVPSKNLLRASEVFYYSHRNPFRGVEIPEGMVDFEEVIVQKDELVLALRKEKYLDILKENKNIHYYSGSASFVSGGEVEVAGEVLVAPRFIIATGARPQVVPFRGIEEVEFLNSTTALDLKVLPASMIILGGRFVAVEMAQIFAHFGTEVTILQRSPLLIPDEEEEISTALRGYLEEEGIKVRTGVKVLEVLEDKGEKVVRAEVEGKSAEFRGGALLLATGNTPNTDGLNLELLDVSLDKRGFIKTDEFMRSTNPGVFAAGDVAGGIQLVTVAAREGTIAATNALEDDECCFERADYSAVPHAIFTHPNVASVGLTEKRAVEKGLSVVTRTLDMNYVPKARAIRDARGLIKIVAEEGTEKILGVHIIAPEAAEVIHQAVLILKKGMTVGEVADKIDVYPTLSEMVKLCAQSFSKDVSQLSCCAG